MTIDNEQAYGAGYRAGRAAKQAGMRPDADYLLLKSAQWRNAGGTGDVLRFETDY